MAELQIVILAVAGSSPVSHPPPGTVVNPARFMCFRNTQSLNRFPTYPGLNKSTKNRKGAITRAPLLVANIVVGCQTIVF